MLYRRIVVDEWCSTNPFSPTTFIININLYFRDVAFKYIEINDIAPAEF